MASDSLRPDLLPPAISAYIAERAAQPDEVLIELRERTSKLGRAAGMQVSAEEGALLTLLTMLVGARRAVEVGTFTGYSAICIARGLEPDGHLLCCDISVEYTSIARQAWATAGVEDRIELRIAPALETLRALSVDTTIDLAFIDADKRGYPDYYEELLSRLRAGGVILVDNTLWSGRVVDESADDDDTQAIRRFNDLVAADDRVDSYVLPVSDGLTLIRKR
jgi:caffeoyl-CoA O-methyltransferase